MKIFFYEKYFLYLEIILNLTYEIYNTYYTSQSDATYMQRDTEGRREISLSTCNNDSTQRLIIWAREK